MDQVSVVPKKPIKVIKLSFQYSLDPRSVRPITDPGDLNSSRC